MANFLLYYNCSKGERSKCNDVIGFKYLPTCGKTSRSPGTSQNLNLTLHHKRDIMNTQQRKGNLNKTRKETNMKNTLTRVDALNIAINSIPMAIESPTEVVEVLTKIRDQIAKPHKASEDTKARAKAKRANERAVLMAQVLPIIREAVADGGTAKEIFERCANALPADFTVAKVQYILLNEMKDEVVKIEAKGKPNVYKMKG